MTVVVTHTTPADSSFSSTGAAAWNADHALSGVGTMAEQDANNVAITGGTINGATVGATTPAAGTFTTLTATTAGTTTAKVWSNTGTSPIADLELQRGTTSTWGGDAFTDYRLRASGGNFILQSQNNTTSVLDLLTIDETNNAIKFSPVGVEQMRVTRTASAVNYVQVTGNITNNAPSVISAGSDANVGLSLSSKATGQIGFFTNSANSNSRHLDITHTGSVVNRFTLTGSQTGIGVVLGLNGSDTNISQVFQSKGTGAIDLAAGSSGVNISNGGTVTAITRTATGGSYTSIPSVAITAPTTAGGVQATATATMFAASATVQSGGTGYTVNDVLTVVGGTFSSAATFTVSAVSAGVVTAVTLTSGGTAYSVLPTNPVSTTGGTGTGATLNITGYGLSTTFTITNAGSGYVEQPTVTFSGGGGSGAAAYATVGSGTTVKSIGATLDVFVDSTSSQAFRFYNSGGTGVNYWSAGAGSSSPFLFARGSTNTQGNIASNGTSSLAFFTNGGATQQFNVSHTASAVNYVQVTGAATSGRVTISSQGSDANVPMVIGTKGSGSLNVRTNDSATTQFAVTSTASAVNYINVTGNTANNAPVISALGTDTNIDLTLTPKGTGNVRFGTYTANMALTIQGYIEIKDSGGTTRRLAVIA